MTKHSLLTAGLMLVTSNIALADSTLTGSPYMGVALSWDHMMGGRDDKLYNLFGNPLDFGSGSSLSAEELSGHLFFGTSYSLTGTPFFISPEIHIGRGMLTSQADKSVGDDDTFANGSPMQRQLNPKLSRQFTSSFVVRAGGNLGNSYQLYGLAGIEVSRFKYSFSYQNIDYSPIPGPIVTGTQSYKMSRWGSAPVVGAGIEKRIKDVKIGLEYRMSFYKRLKFSKLIGTAPDIESVSANFKPRVSSIMLRLSYVF